MKLIISDLERTLTDDMNTWRTLNLEMGVSSEKDYELYNDFNAGRINYEEWTGSLVKEWINNNTPYKDYFIKFFNNIYKPADSAKEFVKKCRDKNYYFYVVSGSFNNLLEIAMKDLGFDEYYKSNELVFDKEGLLKGVIPHDFGFNKELVLKKLKKKYSINYCIGIGDSDNDVSMLKEVDKGILVNPTKRVNIEEVKKRDIIVVDNLREALRII